ncbi:hypothetical protein NQ318_019502 [Aromia moschata]|uniref:Sulfatase N-terminal domain-containing protein n=1 Tax=Aromia moschata TaxID=1265417 RepID=A0AAV8Y0B3_9CUCU|nr:hypothetical protein NQ318_019502 [Aromia moschata]
MRWLGQAVRILVVSYIVADAATVSKRPHIVIVLGDDIGWNDFGFHGSNQIPTPNIDALGYNGIILDKFYTQQTCSPSRAALLTGNYPIRSGTIGEGSMQGTPITAGENRYLPLDMHLLPERLKELGYRTHLVGKWHLGSALKRYTPSRRGFDSHFGYWHGWVGYFDYMIQQTLEDNVTTYNGLDLHHNFEPQWQYQGQYATDLFTRKSLDVIDSHPLQEPLFLLVTHLAAHTGREGVELGVPNITRTDETYSYIDTPERRRYADIVNNMDKSVGQIVNKLSQRDMLRNSIIIVFSDNGAQTVGTYQNFGSSWPLEGPWKGPKEPPFDVEAILNSPVNKAIEKLPDHSPLSRTDILSSRQRLDISWCRDQNFAPNFVPRTVPVRHLP